MLSLLRRRQRSAPSCTVAGVDRIRPNRDVFSATQDGITVLLDLRRQVYLGVDEVGTVIWQGVERGAACSEIESQLASEYDVPLETVQADTRLFIEDLIARGLVVRT